MNTKPFEVRVISFEKLPVCVQEQFLSKDKFVNAVIETENDFGKTYFIKEGFEVFGYLVANNEEKAILTVKLPLIWLSKIFQLPNIVPVIEEEIAAHKERQKYEIL